MKFQLRKALIFILAAAVIACSGCSKIKQINLDSYKIKSVIPNGMKDVDLVINIVVDNPAMQFTVEDPKVEIFRKGVFLGTFTAENVTVPAKSKDPQDVKGHVALEKGQSIPKVVAYLLNFKPEDYTINVDTTVRLKSGAKAHIVRKQLEVADMIKTDEK